MDAKAKILSPTADDLRQLIICDTDFSEAGETDLNVDTMQRLEQLGWLAEGEESGEYALTNAGRLAVRRALGDVVAFVQFKADRVGRTYIAGPMTGYTDFNYPAFNDAAAQLRSLGIAAINPADHGVVQGATWEDYLRSDIAQLATCESIYFLPGWSKSRGALLEHHIATSLGMRLLFADGAEKREAVRLRDELRERAEFEAWAQSIGAVIDADEHGNYVDSGLNHAKLGWQAAVVVTGKQQVGEVQGDGLASAARAGLPFIAYAFSQGMEGAEEVGRAIEAALAATQPVVRGWSGWATQKPGHMPKLWGTREIAELNHDLTGDARLILLSEQPAQAVDLGHARVIELLLTVAEAAYTLADNANDMEACEHVEHADFVALSDALDALDALPDDQPGYTMCEPAKARWALRALIDGQEVQS